MFKISICIPVFNAEDTIIDTINSIKSQKQDLIHEVVICDNSSCDSTLERIKNCNYSKIKLIKFDKFVSGGENLQRTIDCATGDFLFFLGADDVIDRKTIEIYHNNLLRNKNLGVISRSYYWFEYENHKLPVRCTKQIKEDIILDINSDEKVIYHFIVSICQVSGILVKKSLIENKINKRYFIETASVILPLIRESKALLLGRNTVAVRIDSSNTFEKKFYINSPGKAWLSLFNSVFYEKKYYKTLNFLKSKFISKNFDGLIQLRVYGGYGPLFKELILMIKTSPKIILNLKIYIYFLFLAIPNKKFINFIKIYYKRHILSKNISDKITNLVEY